MSAAVIGSLVLGACGGPAPTPSLTERPTPTPVPGPTPVPARTLSVVAVRIELSPRTLEVSANTAFVIHLRNADPADVLHTIAIRRADGTTVLQDQTAIQGGTQVDYVYDPLPPGDYVFICSVHPIPAMTGTLRVH